MADLVLLPPAHSSEGHIKAIRLKDRVVTVTLIPAHRPDNPPAHASLKDGIRAVWPSEDKRAAELCSAGFRRSCGLERRPGARHREREIPSLRRFRPIRCVNTRCATQGVNTNARVIRKCNHSG